MSITFLEAFQLFNSSFSFNIDETDGIINSDGFASLAYADIKRNGTNDIRLTIDIDASFGAIFSTFNLSQGVHTVNGDSYNGFTGASVSSFWNIDNSASSITVDCQSVDGCMNTLWDFSFVQEAIVNAFGMNTFAYSTFYAPWPLPNNTFDDVINETIDISSLVMECDGALSLYQNNIYGSGYGSIIDIDLEGFLAGYGATINCIGNDTCLIDCQSFDACYNLTLNCDDTADCIVLNCDNLQGSVDQWCPIGWNGTGLLNKL